MVYLGPSLSRCLSRLFLLFPFLYFSFCSVCCCIFAVCVLFFPAKRTTKTCRDCSPSFTCLYTALLRSARNVGWEAKEILLHFIPQSAISMAEKPRRSFNLRWEAEKVCYTGFPTVLVGLRIREDLLSWAEKPRTPVTLGWEANEALLFCMLGWEAMKILFYFIPRSALAELRGRKGLVMFTFLSVL